MELIVLGAAAGGGLPQWNCAGGQSHHVWQENRAAQTQASVAIGHPELGYIVINASPDLRQQIIQTPQLHPSPTHQEGVRNSPIKAVIVTNADVDNIAGLLNLREKQAFYPQMHGEADNIVGQLVFVCPCLARHGGCPHQTRPWARDFSS